MNEPQTITILTDPKFRALPAVYRLLVQVGVIGIGVAVDSLAMQWIGFIAVIIMVLALATKDKRRREGMSIAEARQELDEIERRDRNWSAPTWPSYWK